MIKFFRIIRKSQMEKTNYTRYLKYAIGEIILVVIGILIALQINNWNDQRKQQKLSHGYVASLYKDLIETEKLIDSTIGFIQNDSIENQKILNRINLSQDIDTLKKIARYEFNTGFVYISNSFNIKTYQSLINSGNMPLMDTFIQSELVNYNNLSDNLIGVSGSSNDIYLEALSKHVNRYPTTYFRPITGELQETLWQDLNEVDFMASINYLISAKSIFRFNISRRLYPLRNKIDEIKSYIELNYSRLTK